MERNTVHIPAERVPDAEAAIAALKARAAKLACTFVLGMEVLRTYRRKTGRFVYDVDLGASVPCYETMAEVVVWGEAPKLEGWTLWARYDFVTVPGEMLTMAAPGYTMPTDLGEITADRCDHCGHRRHRNDTFLVEHEDGRKAVVGRTCLRDYTGHVTPAAAVAAAGIFADFGAFLGDFDGWPGGAGPEYYPLPWLLALAAYSIDKHGFAKSSDDCATRGHVSFLLDPPKLSWSAMQRWHEEIAEVEDRHHAMASRTMEWLDTVDDSASDYLRNLTAINRAGCVGPKGLGLAVSAVAAYQRHVEKEIRYRQREERKGESEYVGTLKKRIDFEGLVVEMIRSWETAYGTTHLYKFRDGTGNVLVWKASRSAALDTGDKVNLRGTVKAHVEYRGEKQTALTRCKVEKAD